MALQTTGPISFDDLRAEYQRTGALSISALYGQPGIQTSGAISLGDFYGKAMTIIKTVTAGTTNLTLSTLFTSAEWTSTTPKEVVINSGVTIGSTSATAALLTGTGFGGTLKIINNGEIQGDAGAANSGAGGPAINVQAANVTIENVGAIRGGGGGGGKGGTGGTGGNGSYDSIVEVRTPTTGQYNSTTNRWITVYDGPKGRWGSLEGIWNNNQFYFHSGGGSTAPSPPASYTSGIYTYFRGTQTTNTSTIKQWGIYRTYDTTVTTDTYGGAGGAGGNGGVGRGYNVTNAAGAAGANGSAGGTNAGTGGKGGTGATGGTWGTAGGKGATGATGTNGNVSNGSAGAVGVAGGAAGAAITGTARTVINTGTINGAY